MRGTFHPTTAANRGQAREPLEAVAAYDRIAAEYRELSRKRRAYLDAVDAAILRRVPSGATSLLDIGAGDGRRALRITERAGISRVVLAEPSAGMRGLIPPGVEVWDARMEALPESVVKFDVVLCLWNVVGHVPSRELRVAGLQNLRRVCSGLIFLDVLHRYNVAECGGGVVLRRLFSSESGDVLVRWETPEGDVETWGHVFSAGEIEGMIREAGLTVVERVILNYRTGRRSGWVGGGNLFYVLRSIENSARVSRTNRCGRQSTS